MIVDVTTPRKDTMKENTVVAFQNPSDFQKDPLTEVLQAGARELLAQAVEAEVSVFLGSHSPAAAGLSAMDICRNASSADRDQTPCATGGTAPSASLGDPAALRRAKSLEDLMAWGGDFGEAFRSWSAPGLSASTRLKEVWGVEAERTARPSATSIRVDGIYFSARMEEEKQCILVIVGAGTEGTDRHRRRLSRK